MKLSQYTISEALENNVIPEDKKEDILKMDLPSRAEILDMPLASYDISEWSLNDITTSLANYNIRRVESLRSRDDDTESEDMYVKFDYQNGCMYFR